MGVLLCLYDMVRCIALGVGFILDEWMGRWRSCGKFLNEGFPFLFFFCSVLRVIFCDGMFRGRRVDFWFGLVD